MFVHTSQYPYVSSRLDLLNVKT